MKAKLLTTIMGLSAIAPAFAGHNAINTSVNDEYVEAGDALQILIPATGLFATWLYDDPEGAKQLALSVGATQVIVHGTKNLVGRARPNSSSRQSFPSATLLPRSPALHSCKVVMVRLGVYPRMQPLHLWASAECMVSVTLRTMY